MSKSLDDENLLKTIKRTMNTENVEIIKETDSFDFQCQQCGGCCMNRRDIILNPWDIYKASKYLGIEPKEFIMKNTFRTLGGRSKIPMILLDTDEKGYCPLLKFDVKDGGKFKCTINPAKPGACSNHPLGITWGKDTKTGDTTTKYIKVDQCPNSQGHNNMNLVSDWIKPYTDYIDEVNAAHELQTFVNNFFSARDLYYLSKLLVSSKDKAGDIFPESMLDSVKSINDVILEGMHLFIEGTYDYTYADFDINRPFIEQVEENKEKLTKLYEGLQLLVTTLSNAFQDSTGISVSDFIDEMEKDEIDEFIDKEEE